MTALVIAVAVGIVAVLTMGATAVRAVSRLWLRHWVEQRGSATAPILYHLEQPSRLLHAAGTGVTLVVFATGASLTLLDAGRPWLLVQHGLIFALLLVGIGQLLARAVARRWAHWLVPTLVPVMRVIDVLVSPVQIVARAVASQVVRAETRTSEEVARDGIEDLLRDGALEGIGGSEEMAIISGVVQFGDKTASDVMTPRSELFALDEALPPIEMARRLAQAAYSRVPVYRGAVDNIVGMIHVFDVFKVAGERVPPLRPVTVADPNKPASELLFEMLRARRHLAIVRHAAGTVVGIVTLEDLLEELVGDIRDEHDEPAPRTPGGPA